MKPEIIFIAGTGHCGSTVLDLALGCHSEMVGVGELNALLEIENKSELDRLYKDMICSTNERMEDNSYWKGFYPIIKDNIEKSYLEKYRLHHEYFKNKFPGKVMVDSSKNLPVVKKLNRFFVQKKIYPIFLIKDVRNYAHSIYKKHKTNALRSFLDWYHMNTRILNNLENKKIRHKIIGYEELALNPKESLMEICRFLGLKFEKEMLSPKKSSSIIFRGNFMRSDSKKKENFFYDYRWLKENKFNVVATSLPFVMKLNQKLVYSNRFLEKDYYKK